ncbi:MAG TPA: methyltransferase domain-containing protein [Syntrophales bacterium]|nr:methyltransferase domain-containing protein [Syntrophales bacterium]
MTKSEVIDVTAATTRSPIILQAILLFALLLDLCPLAARMDALAYMDSERRVKLDAPFVRTPDYVIAEILSKAGVGKDDILYDLGSGDGRIVIQAALKTGCRSVGIEIDSELVDDSRQNALRAGVTDRVRFVVADIFKEDVSEATVVTIYMSGDVNVRLRPKLLRELRPGTRIATYNFDMGDWKHDDISSFGREDAYFWVVPANFSGKWTWEAIKGRTKTQWDLVLKQEFQEISGHVTRDGTQYAVRNGKIKGDRIRFTLEQGPAGKATPVEFAGRIRRNTIEGTFTRGTDSRPWKALRNPSTMQRIDK